jgi:uncharacterized cupin superfamily protein
VRRLLVVGERRPVEVCLHVDSNKVKVRPTGEIHDRLAARDSWTGEVTGNRGDPA